MEKMKMQSHNLTLENIIRIQELFPGCVTESQRKDGKNMVTIDFDQLRQELSESIVEGPQERYQLNWPGKREALLIANTPITKTLRPYQIESVDFDTTKNLFIEGDNLEALKLLQETYLGKIKMIYIDPPYNTGNDFIYRDNFTINKTDYDQMHGVRDKEGNKIFDEEIWKQNSSSNGRFHSDWLSMIYSRLKLARNLLRNDGVIFISIDDGEVHNLRRVCDEIFGEGNFLADIIWEGNGKNDSRFVSIAHENILFYAKSKDYLISNGINFRAAKEGITDIQEKALELVKKHSNNYEKATEELKEWYKTLNKNNPSWQHRHYSSIDKGGVYFPGDISAESGRGREPYDVKHPITGKNCKIPTRGWPTKATMDEWISNNLVDFGGDETCVPKRKRYLFETDSYVLPSVIYKDSRKAFKSMISMFGFEIFDNPKDLGVVQKYIEIATANDDIILDFFAGSSTTAHAILKLNAEDGGNRKFIMVQFPELCNEKTEAFKRGYKTIADISKERIRRAGQQIHEMSCHKNWKKDIGFRVLKIDSSCMADIYYTPDAINQEQLKLFTDNIKPDRTPDDLLFQILLDWGVDLSLPINKQTIQGKSIFLVDENALVACFDAAVSEELVKELAGLKPLRVVFRDNGFGSDSMKINVEQIFKQISPGTEVKSL